MAGRRAAATLEQVTMIPSANRRCRTASLWCCRVFTSSPFFRLHTLHAALSVTTNHKTLVHFLCPLKPRRATTSSGARVQFTTTPRFSPNVVKFIISSTIFEFFGNSRKHKIPIYQSPAINYVTLRHISWTQENNTQFLAKSFLNLDWILAN